MQQASSPRLLPSDAKYYGDLPIPRFSVSLAGSLSCSLRAASKLVSPKAWLTQTSMLLILSFAETSSASEAIFAPGPGSPLHPCGLSGLPERSMDGAAGTDRGLKDILDFGLPILDLI